MRPRPFPEQMRSAWRAGVRPKIIALVVMARDRRLPLLLVLENCGVEAVPADSRAEARRILDSRYPIQVVLTDTALLDGTWTDVLDDVAKSATKAEVIVCARVDDARLWSPVLESGAYDLIVEPYQREEVQRIVEAAAAKTYIRSLEPAKEESTKTKATGEVA